MIHHDVCVIAGDSHFMTVASKQSHVVLSELSAGSSYIVSVASTQGRAQSDELTSVITTGTPSDKLNMHGSHFFQ